MVVAHGAALVVGPEDALLLLVGVAPVRIEHAVGSAVLAMVVLVAAGVRAVLGEVG